MMPIMEKKKVFRTWFFCKGQKNGPGYAVQTVPVQRKDYWTTIDSPGGLLIRWNNKKNRLVDGVTAAVWGSGGTLLAHRPHKEPKPGLSWWSVGTDLVEIHPDHEELRVVARSMHSPSLHPTLPIMAAVHASGDLMLVHTITGETRARRTSLNPQWNRDGTQLLVEVQDNDGFVLLKVWKMNWAGK